MLSFYFTSLSFKPPLKTSHRLFIRIELPDGSSKTTETTTYSVDNNIAVFSEAFDFVISSQAKTSYFHLEIYEYDQSNPSQSPIIGKTSLYMSSKFFNEGNKLTLPTTYHSDVTLYFVLDASNELKEKLIAVNNEQTVFKTPRESQKEDSFGYSTGQLDILKLGPLFHDFTLAVSPIVLATQKAYNFFTWADPHQTLLYSVAFMLLYFYYRGLAIVFFLVFFRYSSLVIASVIKAKPLKETAETKLQIYKRNILFIQHCMELTVRMNDYYNKLFHDYDKTAIMQIFAVLKKFSLIIAVLFMMYNVNHLLILGYWGFLLYNTSYGGIALKLAYTKAEKLIDIVNNAIMSIVKIEHVWGREVSPMKELNTSADPNLTQSDHSTPKYKTVIPNQKTFVTYENERWWLGRGWCDQMLLGERPSWSDVQGKVELTKESFVLPGPKWRWDGGWEVTVTPHTDQDGWEYATDFLKVFHPKAQAFDYVRRRRWTRKCVQDPSE